MKKVSIHQPEHLPWLGFIHKVMSVDEFVLLDNVQFNKNYFHNRNKIKTSQGWQWLTVPIKKKRNHQNINEVEISYEQDWQLKNLKSIKSSYAKAKYFSQYSKDFKDIYQTKFKLLRDLNIELIKFIFKKFGLNTKIHIASELIDKSEKTELLLSICQKLGADVYLSGISGKDYLDVFKFKKANIKVEFQNFEHPIYQQMHGPFVPEMSSIDLLFNYGHNSLPIL